MTDDEIIPFVLDGIRYVSVSQYMYIQKALLCDNTQIYSILMNTSNPKLINELGAQLPNTIDWSIYASIFYKKAKMTRMIQNPDLYSCY